MLQGPPRPIAVSWRRALTVPLGWLVTAAGLLLYFGLRNVDAFDRVCAFDAHYEFLQLDQVLPAVFCLGLVGISLSLRRASQLQAEIRRRIRSEEEASRLARHDFLTGLPNRRVLKETLERGLARLKPQQQAALLFLDLDEFKSVNDLHGHAAGDALLCEVAARLTAAIGRGDLLARLSGDEFAIYMSSIDSPSQAARLAQAVIAELSAPFQLESGSPQIGVTVGIALAPQDGSDVAVLLRAADVAMYHAKALGRGTYSFFEAEVDAAQRKKSELKSELRHAIAEGQIVPYFQPLVELKTREVVGFEVLARWHHPIHGILAPSYFIELVEELRLMLVFTESILRQACRVAMTWPTQQAISINVSPTLLLDPELVGRIQAVLRESGMAASRLEVEITEEVLIRDLGKAQDVINRLRDCGIRTALDDFGVGQSSLGLLRELQIDKIKIDQSFFLGERRNVHELRYIQAILNIGQALGIDMTAEGIETEDTLANLTALGCRFGQGYLLGKPAPAAIAMDQGPSIEPTRSGEAPDRVTRCPDQKSQVAVQTSGLRWTPPTGQETG
jgi:diguanylate cyclase (GGDEF)-like protein